jgi:predicted DNA-binding transcriptional regulator AlpA
VSNLLPIGGVLSAIEVSRATFWRIRRDPLQAFPRPLIIGRRERWKRSEVERWLDSRRKASATPGLLAA